MVVINDDTFWKAREAKTDLWAEARSKAAVPEQLGSTEVVKLAKDKGLIARRLMGVHLDEVHLLYIWGTPQFGPLFRYSSQICACFASVPVLIALTCRF